MNKRLMFGQKAPLIKHIPDIIINEIWFNLGLGSVNEHVTGATVNNNHL